MRVHLLGEFRVTGVEFARRTEPGMLECVEVAASDPLEPLEEPVKRIHGRAGLRQVPQKRLKRAHRAPDEHGL